MASARDFRKYSFWQEAVDFAHFLDLALGSAFEVETQLKLDYRMRGLVELSNNEW